MFQHFPNGCRITQKLFESLLRKGIPKARKAPCAKMLHFKHIFTLAPKQHEQISISKVTFVGSRAWLDMNCFSGVSLINPHMLRKFALATLPPNCCGARNHRGIYWWHLVAQQYTCCFENGMRFYAKRGSTFFRKVVSKSRFA